MFSIREKVDIRVEVEDDHLMVVLPQRMDDIAIPWQEAWIFGDVLERAAEDIPVKPLIIDPVYAEIQANSLKINTYRDKYVVLLFEHVDRLKLSYEAARTVARAIKAKAQDLDYKTRGVHIRYDAPGRKGRPTPFWDVNALPKTIRTR